MHGFKKADGPQVVYYYPKSNVYYDGRTGRYIYFSAEEDKWVQATSFTEEQKLSLGERALIDSPAAPVWKNNATDRMIYSVSLYAPSDLSKKFVEDSISNLPRKKEPVIARKDMKVTKDSVKEKSGLGKLLDKIFGKKKDKEE